MITDHTTEDRVIRALRECEERYRLVCLATKDVVYEWEVSSNQVRVAGGSVESLLGHPLPTDGASWECWWAQLHPSDHDRILAKYQQWLRTSEQTWSEEYRFRRKDGGYATVWDRAHAVRNEYGRVIRVVGSLTDLTALRRIEGRSRVLAEASRRFAEARFDWSEILDTIVELVIQEAGDLCLISMVSPEGGWLDPVAMGHRDPTRLPAIENLLVAHPTPVGEGLLGKVAHTACSMLFPSLSPDAVESLIAPSSRSGSSYIALRSVVVIPLISRGVVAGTLFVARDQDRTPLNSEDQYFLEDLARRAAAAVDCAQLHREAVEVQEELTRALNRERHLTDQLQRCFRSELPIHLPGYTLGHVYHTALDEARIGGDFYDLFPLGGNKYGIMIGDVSGKGIQAAVVTVKARYYLRGYAAQHADPAEVVRLLNEVLCEDLQGEAFVTLFYGVLSLPEHRMTYVTAGHELPLLLADGTVTPLHTTGPLLGVTAGLAYEAKELELPPGATLLLYTDGATDARNRERFLGMHGLATCLARRSRTTSGQILAECMASDIEEFACGYLSDDMALMLLQRTQHDADSSPS